MINDLSHIDVLKIDNVPSNGLVIRFDGNKLLEISPELLCDNPQEVSKMITNYLVEFVKVNKQYFDRRYGKT